MASVRGAALAEDELFGINYFLPAPSVAFEMKIFMTQYKTPVVDNIIISSGGRIIIIRLLLRRRYYYSDGTTLIRVYSVTTKLNLNAQTQSTEMELVTR